MRFIITFERLLKPVLFAGKVHAMCDTSSINNNATITKLAYVLTHVANYDFGFVETLYIL